MAKLSRSLVEAVASRPFDYNTSGALLKNAFSRYNSSKAECC